MKPLQSIAIACFIGLITTCIWARCSGGQTGRAMNPFRSQYAPLIDRMTQAWIKDVTPLGLPNERWAHEEVRKNVTEHVEIYESVVADPVSVQVTKTAGGEQSVIYIRGQNGKGASLWLDSSGEVRSISEY